MISLILIYCLHFTHIVSAYDFDAFQIKYGLLYVILLKIQVLPLGISSSMEFVPHNCPTKSVLKSNYVSVILELAIYLYASMFIFGVYFKL